MKALFRCPHCGQVLEGEGGNSGIEYECPTCGKEFLLETMVAQKLPNAFQWYLGCFEKYFKFNGRARRREFWWANLVHCGVIFGVFFIGAILDLEGIPILFILASSIPMYSVQVRRLHDTNKSGWWIFLQFVPVVQIAYYVWLATDGDVGTNRFGPDPKGR